MNHHFIKDQKVIYRAPHVRPDEPGEEGVVTTDGGGGYVFVRYGNDTTAKATPRGLLTPLTGASRD